MTITYLISFPITYGIVSVLSNKLIGYMLKLKSGLLEETGY